MAEQTIGVIAGRSISVGLVAGHELAAPLRTWPPPGFEAEAGEATDIHGLPVQAIADKIADSVRDLCDKGARMAEMLAAALAARGLRIPVYLFNDADVTAAGIAATKGQLERLVRVWTLGHGIGFGRYPHGDGVWEGGHMVVTLDTKETYCGCGGRGHLEGIMGHRAMRLRFMDMEPEEVFAAAAQGDARCAEFELLWHRALAAATAGVIHMGGPGKFFISGMNSRFVKVGLLNQYLHEMVTMSPLEGSVFEVVPTDERIAVVGAAVNASRAA
jgi:predicted NBD/HSP70 family sugar kinase